MLHIVQNDPEVPPGNLTDHLTIPYVIHQPYRDGVLPELQQISALIVLGGAMGANDDKRHPFLTGLKELISTVVTAGIPYLGICLGGQLLAAALGGRVASQRWEEQGMLTVSLNGEGAQDELFRGIPLKFPTFQWHHDSFDIPECGVLLASSAACPHQAFRVGECVWGVQFHPEVTEAIIRDWAVWDHAPAAHVEGLVADFLGGAALYTGTARQLAENFIRIARLR